MHPLKIWRQANNLTQREAAQKFGVTEGCLRLWERNRSRPHPQHMRNIIKLTKGQVRPDHWYDVP